MPASANMQDQLDIIIASRSTLGSIRYNPDLNTVVLLRKDTQEIATMATTIGTGEFVPYLLEQANIDNPETFIFLSADDQFQPAIVLAEIHKALHEGLHNQLTLLIPYKEPPVFGHREDGKVASFIVSNSVLNATDYNKAKGRFWRLAYYTVNKHLNAATSGNVEIVQVNRPPTVEYEDQQELFREAMMVMPHKGSVKLLNRSLHHIRQMPVLPSEIGICFDDLSYKKANNLFLQQCTRYVNKPLNVGPYLPRHYSIRQSDKEYIFFHDSDDISVKQRFVRQMNELKARELDLIGSHELRIDQFAKCLLLIRFPLDVNKSLSEGYCHPLFHPTSLITRRAYLKTQGFSTNQRFAYDTQFLIRAYFFLKIGNVDDFLYLRFKRANSLTTSGETKLGNEIRMFLLWRWALDFRLILQKKLRFEDSSLTVQEHEFDYELLKL